MWAKYKLPLFIACENDKMIGMLFHVIFLIYIPVLVSLMWLLFLFLLPVRCVHCVNVIKNAHHGVCTQHITMGNVHGQKISPRINYKHSVWWSQQAGRQLDHSEVSMWCYKLSCGQWFTTFQTHLMLQRGVLKHGELFAICEHNPLPWSGFFFICWKEWKMYSI